MKLKITGQQVDLYSNFVTVADKSINAVPIEFDFNTEWDSYAHKVLQITQGDNTYNVVLSDNKCMLPSDVKNGSCLMSVFGYSNSGSRLTTAPCVVEIQKSGFGSDNTTPIPPTPDLYSQLLMKIDETEEMTQIYKTVAIQSAQTATEKADISISKAVEAVTAADNAKVSEVTAVNAKDTAVNKAAEAGTSSTQSQQALADLLAILGTDIATLVNGKIPVSQIPSIATTEIYTVANQAEMDALVVQNGDICIRSDEDKSYIYSDGWVYLTSPTDYASRAGYAETAKTAENATMINNHRLVEMTAAEFANAVKDPNTYYLVG